MAAQSLAGIVRLGDPNKNAPISSVVLISPPKSQSPPSLTPITCLLAFVSPPSPALRFLAPS